MHVREWKVLLVRSVGKVMEVRVVEIKNGV